MKVIYIGQDIFMAEIIRSKLRDAGIESSLMNEYTSNILPYSSAITSLQIQVVVASEDYDKAIEITGIEQEKTVCPFCGSSNISFGLKGAQRAKKMFAIIFATLTISPIGNIRCNYYCRDCRQDF